MANQAITVRIKADGADFLNAMGAIEAAAEKSGATISSRFERAATGGTDKLAESTDLLGSRMQRLERYLVGGGIVYGMERLASISFSTGKAFADTAGSFEAMQISLDTVTKGQGAEWMEKLSNWARNMPVSTEEAVKAFTMLRAMGLTPTIRDMTTLVDASSAIGGGQGTMEGIARALGQIQTKNKVNAEELMQLAEHGIPAYEILQEKLGLTAKQVQNIGNESIAGGRAVQALLSGMEERFGGQSVRMQESYRGIISTLTDDWKLFQKAVMDGGAFETVKDRLKDLDAFINFMAERQQNKNILEQMMGEKPEGRGWEKILLPEKIPFTPIPNWSPSMLWTKGASDDQLARLEKYKNGDAFEAFQNLSEDPLGDKRARKGIFAFSPTVVLPKSEAAASGLDDQASKTLNGLSREIERLNISLLPNEFQRREATINLEYRQDLNTAGGNTELSGAAEKKRQAGMTGLNRDMDYNGAEGLTLNRGKSMEQRAMEGLIDPAEYRKDFDKARQIRTDFWEWEDVRTTEHDNQLRGIENEGNEKRIQLKYSNMATGRAAIIQNGEMEAEMARARFEAQYGQWASELAEKHDLYVAAQENLNVDLALIQGDTDTRLKEDSVQGWIQLGDTISQTMMQAMTTSGNAFQNIANGFENMLESMAAQWAAKAAVFAFMNMILPGSGGFAAGVGGFSKYVFGFAEGGYTGNGPRDEIAGVVHRGEYVISAPAVSRMGGPGYFDRTSSAAKVAGGNSTTVHDHSVLTIYMQPGEKLEPMTAKRFAEMFRKMKRGE